MNRSLLVLVLVTLSTIAWGQDMDKEKCPRFHLQGPHGIFGSGQVIPYFVRWTGLNENLKLEYSWRVFGAGELVAGQGTPIMEVRMPKSGSVTVTVEIGGLDSKCRNTAAETAHIDRGPEASKLNEYSGPLTRLPKTHLERILHALKQNPGSQLYIIVSGSGRETRRSISNKRKVLDRDLFAEFEGLPPVTIVEYLQVREDKLVIWLVPPGAATPHP